MAFPILFVPNLKMIACSDYLDLAFNFCIFLEVGRHHNPSELVRLHFFRSSKNVAPEGSSFRSRHRCFQLFPRLFLPCRHVVPEDALVKPFGQYQLPVSQLKPYFFRQCYSSPLIQSVIVFPKEQFHTRIVPFLPIYIHIYPFFTSCQAPISRKLYLYLKGKF